MVFGHVLSGQTIVDSIENLSIDSETNRPSKDVVISTCGQFEMNSSKKEENFDLSKKSSFCSRFRNA